MTPTHVVVILQEHACASHDKLEQEAHDLHPCVGHGQHILGLEVQLHLTHLPRGGRTASGSSKAEDCRAR